MKDNITKVLKNLKADCQELMTRLKTNGEGGHEGGHEGGQVAINSKSDIRSISLARLQSNQRKYSKGIEILEKLESSGPLDEDMLTSYMQLISPLNADIVLDRDITPEVVWDEEMAYRMFNNITDYWDWKLPVLQIQNQKPSSYLIKGDKTLPLTKKEQMQVSLSNVLEQFSQIDSEAQSHLQKRNADDAYYQFKDKLHNFIGQMKQLRAFAYNKHLINLREAALKGVPTSSPPLSTKLSQPAPTKLPQPSPTKLPQAQKLHSSLFTPIKPNPIGIAMAAGGRQIITDLNRWDNFKTAFDNSVKSFNFQTVNALSAKAIDDAIYVLEGMEIVNIPPNSA